MACLEIEAGRKTPRESCCAVCWFPHAVTFPIKHRWWYTFPEYSKTQVHDIKARIYRLNERVFNRPCVCAMNCDGYDCEKKSALERTGVNTCLNFVPVEKEIRVCFRPVASSNFIALA